MLEGVHSGTPTPLGIVRSGLSLCMEGNQALAQFVDRAIFSVAVTQSDVPECFVSQSAADQQH